MADRLLTMLGLMRKARAIAIGESQCGEAARAGRAKLLMLAKDASDNAVKRAEGFVYGRSTELITLPYTKDEISLSVGLPGCSMLAVTDGGFSSAFAKGLMERFGSEYEQLTSLIPTEDRTPNTRIGKRRKCV